MPRCRCPRGPDGTLRGAKVTLESAQPPSTPTSAPCAVVTGMDLRGVHIPGAQLQCANLSNARLTDANLQGADIRVCGGTGEGHHREGGR